MDGAPSLIAKAAALAAKEGAGAASAWLLAFLGAAHPALPAARIAAAAAHALAGALIAQASPIEAKLDRLLREPWKTGSRELLEALTLPAAGAAERRLRAERIKAGLMRLESAATLAADDEDAALTLLIRALQAVGYAAVPGGKPSCERRLRDVDAAARALRQEAETFEARSRGPRAKFAAPSPDAMTRLRSMREAPPKRFDDGSAAGERVAELQARAAKLREEAGAWERFGRIVRSLGWGEP